MSSYKAIAGVSQSLVNLLGDRMTEPAAITVAPPDVVVDNLPNIPRLNIYLYQLSENSFLKNQEIPGNGHPGAYGHPPLSLNLHYIFTAFGVSETGPDSDMHAQYVLGDAMRVVHDYSIISANLMQVKSPGKTVLDPTLLDEFEQIKLTLQPKSLEEISKIWTALPKVNFRRSVTYEASVVQIASQQPRTIGLPVRQRRVYALTMRSPQIDDIFVQPPPFPGASIAAAEEGETLRLTGQNFLVPNPSLITSVIIDGATNAPAPISTPKADLIDVTIPVGQLLIGIHSLQVVQNVPPGQLPVLPGGYTSNVVGFQLLPKLATVGPGAPGQIAVSVNPAVKPSQERTLLLGDYAVPRVPPQPNDSPSTNLLFQLPQPPNDPIPSGTYLVRVRVDGAESRLQLDTNVTPPTYVGPTVTV